MVRKITLQQADLLTDKFKLQEYQRIPSPWLMPETVQPIVDFQEMLSYPYYVSPYPSVTTTGHCFFQAVPKGETWKIWAIYAGLSTGVYTFNAIELRPYRNNPTTSWMPIYVFPSATEVAYILPQPITLRELDGISIRINAYTSTGDLNCQVIYQKMAVS